MKKGRRERERERRGGVVSAWMPAEPTGSLLSTDDLLEKKRNVSVLTTYHELGE
jgi:hypothetical protein